MGEDHAWFTFVCILSLSHNHQSV